MPLKISVKMGERVIINGAVISISKNATIIIENKVALLREKHIMREEQANTPSRRIYFMCQLAYLDSDNYDNYFKAIQTMCADFAQAAPGSLTIIARMGSALSARDYFRLLKVANELIDYETGVLSASAKSI